MKTATFLRPAGHQLGNRKKLRHLPARRLCIRKILVPVDFSEPSLLAIDYASKVATRFGAELSLIHVFEPQSPFVRAKEIPPFVADAKAELQAREHLRSAAELHGLPLRSERVHVQKGRAAEEICRLAAKIKIDLIVIPTRGNTGLKHFLLGSTTAAVIRLSPCPVLVLRPKSRPPTNDKLPIAAIRFRRILVPIDFSSCSLTGLEYAKNLTRECASTLLLMHSLHVQYYVTNDEYSRYDFPMVVEEAEKIAQKEMRQVEKKTRLQGIEVESSIQFGHPGNEICDAAENRRADLIVIATHGRIGLAHAFIGSTAEHVVRHAPCPVLVVPMRLKPSSEDGQ